MPKMEIPHDIQSLDMLRDPSHNQEIAILKNQSLNFKIHYMLLPLLQQLRMPSKIHKLLDLLRFYLLEYFSNQFNLEDFKLGMCIIFTLNTYHCCEY